MYVRYVYDDDFIAKHIPQTMELNGVQEIILMCNLLLVTIEKNGKKNLNRKIAKF